jgi:hypothetical protein
MARNAKNPPLTQSRAKREATTRDLPETAPLDEMDADFDQADLTALTSYAGPSRVALSSDDIAFQ